MQFGGMYHAVWRHVPCSLEACTMQFGGMYHAVVGSMYHAVPSVKY